MRRLRMKDHSNIEPGLKASLLEEIVSIRKKRRHQEVPRKSTIAPKNMKISGFNWLGNDEPPTRHQSKDH